MNFEGFTDSQISEIAYGLIIGILSFIFGHRRGRKNHREKDKNPDKPVDLTSTKKL